MEFLLTTEISNSESTNIKEIILKAMANIKLNEIYGDYIFHISFGNDSEGNNIRLKHLFTQYGIVRETDEGLEFYIRKDGKSNPAKYGWAYADDNENLSNFTKISDHIHHYEYVKNFERNITKFSEADIKSIPENFEKIQKQRNPLNKVTKENCFEHNVKEFECYTGGVERTDKNNSTFNTTRINTDQVVSGLSEVFTRNNLIQPEENLTPEELTKRFEIHRSNNPVDREPDAIKRDNSCKGKRKQ